MKKGKKEGKKERKTKLKSRGEHERFFLATTFNSLEICNQNIFPQQAKAIVVFFLVYRIQNWFSMTRIVHTRCSTNDSQAGKNRSAFRPYILSTTNSKRQFQFCLSGLQESNSSSSIFSYLFISHGFTKIWTPFTQVDQL